VNRRAAALLTTAGVAAALIVLAAALPSLTAQSPSGRWEYAPEPLVYGVLTGLTYGVLSVGLVLVYRVNRVVNFAHGAFGALAGAVFLLLAGRYGIPYWPAFTAGVLAAAASGAVAETAVVRRLRSAPRLMSVVATLGVGQFLALVAASVAPRDVTVPPPPGMPAFSLGSIEITPSYSGMLIMAPLLTAGLAVFLRFSRTGIAIRCAAANPDAARLAGIFAGRMSSVAWALAAALSAVGVMIVSPTQVLLAGGQFGPSLLVRALAGAVIAGMTSMPLAFAAGIGVGVVEQLLLWNYPQSGLTEPVLLVVVLVALAVRRGRSAREEESASWTALQPRRPLPRAVLQLPAVRWTRRLLVVAAALAGLSPVVLLDSSETTALVGVAAYAVVALSVTVLSGLGGQLSLGQFAVAGVGAAVSALVTARTGAVPLGMVLAATACAALSLLLGLPALRWRGLLLTVTTLAFAVSAQVWLLPQGWLLGDGLDPGRPVVAGRALDTGNSYYLVAFGALVLAMALVTGVQRSRLGRSFVAVRDNEGAARAFGLSPVRVKVQALLLSGALAGLGGAVFGHSLSQLGASAFPSTASIDVVAVAVLGGATSVGGPVLGALYVVGLPTFVPLDEAGLAATALGWLLLVLYVPHGLAEVGRRLLDRLLLAVAGERAVAGVPQPPPLTPGEPRTSVPLEEVGVRAAVTQPAAATAGGRSRPAAGGHLLRATGLAKRYGGVVAVADVSLEVAPGEVLGLIGPNGAGKTTTFELLSGFSRPDGGRVEFGGTDVTRWSPQRRTGVGLVRSFQDAALFATLTVEQTVALAARPRGGGSVRSRRRREAGESTEEFLDLFGLDPYREARIAELSTGTRRLVEVACLVALRPRLLLLDEPSSGVAQRETEALGRLLRRIRAELDLTMVVIEHDIPLVMSLSDRIVAMADGRVLAEGSPQQVRDDPAVVAAYLGRDPVALQRSGTAAATPAP
jgi:ABC-type branched-subunit amino acid transport system ATPase component/ABC-type branched-subunit amino acid transport system permease subunit